MSDAKIAILLAVHVVLSGISFGMYDTKAGRFTQQDPLGTQPAGNQVVNTFSPLDQYNDGTNLYQPMFHDPPQLWILWAYGEKTSIMTKQGTGQWRRSILRKQPKLLQKRTMK